jgi:hypothetical protein
MAFKKLLDEDTEAKGTAAGAAVEAAGDAATLGYMPNIKASIPLSKKLRYIMDQDVLDALSGKAAEEAEAQGLTDEVEDYDTVLNQELAKKKQREIEHPKASLAGTVAGSLLPIGMAAKGGKTAFEAAKSTAKFGTILGAAANPGDEYKDPEEEKDRLQLKERALNSVLGGALGGLLGAGGHKVASKLKTRAASKELDKAVEEVIAKETAELPKGERSPMFEGTDDYSIDPNSFRKAKLKNLQRRLHKDYVSTERLPDESSVEHNLRDKVLNRKIANDRQEQNTLGYQVVENEPDFVSKYPNRFSMDTPSVSEELVNLGKRPKEANERVMRGAAKQLPEEEMVDAEALEELLKKVKN